MSKRLRLRRNKVERAPKFTKRINTVKPRMRRQRESKNKDNFVSSEIIDHYDYFSVPPNVAKEEKADTQAHKPNKPPLEGENKEENESRTSDSKKNANVVFEVDKNTRANNPNESNLSYSQMPDVHNESHFKEQKGWDVSPIQMKSHLTKAEHNDQPSRSQPEMASKKEDLSSTLPNTDAGITKNLPSRPVQTPGPPQMKPAAKPPSPKPAPKQTHHTAESYIPDIDSHLIGIHKKTEYLMNRLGDSLQTSQILSTTKKAELIRRLWNKLSEGNQEIIKATMEKQFNIDLTAFDISPHPIAVHQLNYLRPTIIEYLFQQVDLFFSSLDIEYAFAQQPPIPNGPLLSSNLSRFASRGGLKRKATERNYSSQKSNSSGLPQGPPEKYASMGPSKSQYSYGTPELNRGASSKMYQSQELPQNMGISNGSYGGLNYA